MEGGRGAPPPTPLHPPPPGPNPSFEPCIRLEKALRFFIESIDCRSIKPEEKTMLRQIKLRIKWMREDIAKFFRRLRTKIRMAMFWAGLAVGYAIVHWAWRRAVIVKVIEPSRD